MSVRAFSYGGGVQSTACLVLAAEGKIDYPDFLFCNVGEDSENPDTLRYVEEVAKPFAASAQLAFHELRWVKRDGTAPTIYGELMADGSFCGIPIRFEGGGSPGIRSCTHHWKIDVAARWLRQAGATPKEPGVIALGISLDELHRARSGTPRGHKHYTHTYPLIDLRLDRAQCHRIITEAGLPIPPKSACWFCPYKTLSRWGQLRDQRPDLFDAAARLEERLNEKRRIRRQDGVFLTDALIPLREAVGTAVQPGLFADEEDDSCESGYCMT